jgi:hypothetical protein
LVLCKFFLFHRPISFSARDLSICNESRLLLDYTTNLIDLAPTSPAYAQAASPTLFTIDKSPADRSLDVCAGSQRRKEPRPITCGNSWNSRKQNLFLPLTKKPPDVLSCVSVCVCLAVLIQCQWHPQTLSQFDFKQWRERKEEGAEDGELESKSKRLISLRAVSRSCRCFGIALLQTIPAPMHELR